MAKIATDLFPQGGMKYFILADPVPLIGQINVGGSYIYLLDHRNGIRIGGDVL